MNWILENIWATGAGLTAILFLVGVILSKSKLRVFGTKISAWGRSKLGKEKWEKIEAKIEEMGKEVKEGMNADDQNGTK